jgi:hypothetical protein
VGVAQRRLLGGGNTAQRSEPGGQNTPRAGRFVGVSSTYGTPYSTEQQVEPYGSPALGLRVGPPQCVQHAEGVDWTSTTSPKTVTLSIRAGDVLVVGAGSGATAGLGDPPTNDGAALTWTLQQATFGSSVNFAVWTATGDSTRTLVVSFTNSAGTKWGCWGRVWRGSLGIGSSAMIGPDASSPYTATLTTLGNNSAVDMTTTEGQGFSGAYTYYTASAGPFIERLGQAGDAGGGGPVHRCGFYPVVGPLGTYTVGWTTPSGSASGYVIAVEVRGGMQPPAQLQLLGAT